MHMYVDKQKFEIIFQNLHLVDAFLVYLFQEDKHKKIHDVKQSFFGLKMMILERSKSELILLHKYLVVVLSYCPDLPCPALEARAEAPSNKKL